MVQTVIAKCENCGAALRVSEAAGGTVTCEYCGTESMVGGAPGAGGAPTVRIDKAPTLVVNTFATAVVAVPWFFAGCVFLAVPAMSQDGYSGYIVGGPVALLFWALAAAGTLDWRRQSRARAQQLWLRDNGLPGRATVERIRAGDGRDATLGLKIELTGQPERHIEHAATIPELLVPRLVDGLTLPVIVHPSDPDKIEVQWHLV